MWRVPGHLLVQPDQQRPAITERSVVVGPVGGAVAGGLWLAHAAHLTAWINDVNPVRREFCNNAHAQQEAGIMRIPAGCRRRIRY